MAKGSGIPLRDRLRWLGQDGSGCTARGGTAKDRRASKGLSPRNIVAFTFTERDRFRHRPATFPATGQPQRIMSVGLTD
jgi:hypothetical protein